MNPISVAGCRLKFMLDPFVGDPADLGLLSLVKPLLSLYETKEITGMLAHVEEYHARAECLAHMVKYHVPNNEKVHRQVVRTQNFNKNSLKKTQPSPRKIEGSPRAGIMPKLSVKPMNLSSIVKAVEPTINKYERIPFILKQKSTINILDSTDKSLSGTKESCGFFNRIDRVQKSIIKNQRHQQLGTQHLSPMPHVKTKVDIDYTNPDTWVSPVLVPREQASRALKKTVIASLNQWC